MKNLNEYKAEILIRSEKRIKAKRERRIKTFAVVVPLCAALVFGGIIMIPEMLFAGFDGAETEKAEMADGTGNPQLFRYVEFTVNGEFSVNDADRVADAYFKVEELFDEIIGGELGDLNEDNGTGTTEKESDDAYLICFKTVNGESKNYRLFENTLYDCGSGRSLQLSEMQRSELLVLFGIAN